jgi:HK97 family phage portal protein
MLNLVTSGNSYAEITSGGYVPLMSVQMQVQLLRDGSIQYEYTDFNGTKRIIPESKIWHVKLFGNSIIGMSPLGYARQSIGVSLATENRVGKISKNGGKVSGILTVDHILNEKQREALRGNMKNIAEGDTDTLKILEADMKFQQTALSPQDLQMLESRRFNVEDIARFMGVPSVLINDTAGSTTWGSGIEQIINGFYKINMKPYLERFESSLKRHLIPRADWDTIDIEFDFDSLLRASKQDRMTAKSVAINSGQLTPNEARNDEGLEDKEGGDDIYLNGSLVKAGAEPEKKEIIEVDNENDPT